MQFQTEVYKIADHFISAIINGDETGLEDVESQLLEGFIQEVTRGRKLGHFNIEPQEPEFTRCEVCGLQAMCVTVLYHFRVLAVGQFDD